jgi:hypothetical protein
MSAFEGKRRWKVRFRSKVPRGRLTRAAVLLGCGSMFATNVFYPALPPPINCHSAGNGVASVAHCEVQTGRVARLLGRAHFANLAGFRTPVDARASLTRSADWE